MSIEIFKVSINPLYNLSLFCMLIFLTQHSYNLPNSNNAINDSFQKIIQIEKEGEYHFTYYVNKNNISEITSKLGIPNDDIIHGMKYYTDIKNKILHSEPIVAVHKFSLNIPININSASEHDLVSLPGIGIKTARAIILYRDKNGNFNKTADLKKIYGIGLKKFSKIQSFITVD